MKQSKVIISSEDIKNYKKFFRANFVNSLSGMKSANLIATKSSKGFDNLSIISSVIHIGANPALVGFISRPETPGTRRQTLENIRETKFFTINHINSLIYEKAHQTSARYPIDVSEFEEVGLKTEYLNDFYAPFVKESNLKIALELSSITKIEENNTFLVIGSVKFIEILDGHIHEEGHIEIEELNSVCISGLNSYHKTSMLKRLPYAKVKDAKSDQV